MSTETSALVRTTDHRTKDDTPRANLRRSTSASTRKRHPARILNNRLCPRLISRWAEEGGLSTVEGRHVHRRWTKVKLLRPEATRTEADPPVPRLSRQA